MVADRAAAVATLGGGCFWCLEALLAELRGVRKVESGYAGGDVPEPTYQQVCSGATGHAEVVQVTFDPDILSYSDLLRIFLTAHDPTTSDRQGPDVGRQYRSIILYHSPEQKETAERVIEEVEAEGVWENPIVTEVAPLKAFYPAEPYHRNFYALHPEQAYCQAVIAPKLASFRKRYVDRLQGATEGTSRG